MPPVDAATRREVGFERPDVRLAELVAALSLGIDLGFGQPMEHVLRQCLLALRMADRLGLDDSTRSVVYYTALLVTVGCHADAHEQAKWFGDDIELKSHKYDHAPRSLASVAAVARLVGQGNPPLHRFRIGLDLMVSGRRELSSMMGRHAELACSLAVELGLDSEVQRSVAAAYEFWDGRGWPLGLRGEQIPIAARICQLTEWVEVAHRLGGVDAALLLARERAGSQFDPGLTDLLDRQATMLFAELESSGTWEAVIAAEPSLRMTLSPERIDGVLLGVASFVDLKSPYTLGHARAVSELAAAAGARLGHDPADVVTLRRVGLVLGLGRLGISNAIWDKPGALGAGEWERVRLQPYLTERMLSQSSWLAPLGAIAVQHRERLDGSGYPRALSGSAIGPLARIAGVADAYQSMCEPRPYREALDPGQAAAELRSEVARGLLDADAAAAVLACAGHAVERRPVRPAGLTAREVEVLRLLALGCSNRQIADRLVISPKTARNHVEHIYAKIQVSSRVQASQYALQHGLLPRQEYPGP